MATHSISLAWTASVDTVDGYNIYRSLSSGTETLPPESPLNGTTLITGVTYADNTVTLGNTYFYEVRASRAGVESVVSNEVTATVSLPEPATNLAVTDVS